MLSTPGGNQRSSVPGHVQPLLIASAPNPSLPAIKRASLLSFIFGLLMFVPIIVLGGAIGWPAILDEPASNVLPLIKAQAGAVFIGYLSYLIYSILFFPTIAGLVELTSNSFIGRLATAFALVSSLARSIGILRWLTVMPMLANLYLEGQQPTFITLVYQTINNLGGAIGELLGVSLFGALAVALTAWGLHQAGIIAGWLSGFGLLAAAGLLLPWLETLGINLGPIISISVSLVQLWFLALAIALWQLGRSMQNDSMQNGSVQNDSMQNGSVQNSRVKTGKIQNNGDLL
jgi:hypothetical protein